MSPQFSMNAMRMIVIPLLFISFGQAYAQDAYESLLLDGKRWQMEYSWHCRPNMVSISVMRNW